MPRTFNDSEGGDSIQLVAEKGRKPRAPTVEVESYGPVGKVDVREPKEWGKSWDEGQGLPCPGVGWWTWPW